MEREQERFEVDSAHTAFGCTTPLLLEPLLVAVGDVYDRDCASEEGCLHSLPWYIPYPVDLHALVSSRHC
jgi:hypothetical protein